MPKVKIDKTATRDLVVLDESGAIVQEEHEESKEQQVITPAEPPFVKMYLQDIMYLCNMPAAYTELIHCLLKRTTYANAEEGLCVTLAQYTKTKILSECGWQNMQSLNNALNKLTKSNIIKRLGTGVYQFNPYLFGRGEWKDISKIRMEWNYDSIKGKTFKTAFGYSTTDGTTESEPLPEPDSIPFDDTEQEKIPEEAPKKRNRKKKTAEEQEIA